MKYNSSVILVVVIGSSHRRRAKPPVGTVLIINLLGKGLTPRACMGDGGINQDDRRTEHFMFLSIYIKCFSHSNSYFPQTELKAQQQKIGTELINCDEGKEERNKIHCKRKESGCSKLNFFESLPRMNENKIQTQDTKRKRY